MNLTTSQIVKLALPLAACAAVVKFVPNKIAKTAAVAVGAVIVARQLPVVGPALS